jgi:hypothetical protein
MYSLNTNNGGHRERDDVSADSRDDTGSPYLPPMQQNGGDTLLKAEQVARRLNVRPKTVYGLGIPCVRLSLRTKRWRHGDVDAWIESRKAAI